MVIFDFFFDPRYGRGQEPRDDQVLIRTIREPGRVIGWSVMVEPYLYRDAAMALVDTKKVLMFERDVLEAYARRHSDFGVAFMEWVLGNRLRETRIRLMARHYESEIMAIRALLDQSAEQLSTASPLHKIPFYLENGLTLSDAFQALELLQAHGTETERNPAEPVSRPAAAGA